MSADPNLQDRSDAGAALRQGEVTLPGGRPRLAVRTGDGPGRPFLLVHGLASNARLWDGVAQHLLAAGHAVIAVDQRGHGLSEHPPTGYDTDTCADDLDALIDVLGLTGDRAPIVVGQSWGGNVVLSLAARHDGVAAVCCVDGGWIRLADQFPDFEHCWQVLEPPRLDGMRFADLAARIRSSHEGWPPEAAEAFLACLVELPDGGVRARLDREHHRQIVRSLYEGDPRAWYPSIHVPVLLCPAIGPTPSPGEEDRARVTRAAVSAALDLLPHGQVRWYPGAHHDLHAQHPDLLADDLRDLAKQVDGGGAQPREGIGAGTGTGTGTREGTPEERAS